MSEAVGQSNQMTPEDSVRYSGTWYSSRYPSAFSRGNVWIKLPVAALRDDAPAMEVVATIQYLGLYRMREKADITIVMKGRSAQSREEYCTPQDTKFNLKPAEGKLEFHIETIVNDKIQGTFSLSDPGDNGRFEIEMGDNHVKECIIM